MRSLYSLIQANFDLNETATWTGIDNLLNFSVHLCSFAFANYV